VSIKKQKTQKVPSLLCLVDRASRYICVMETKLMHYLSSVYYVNQPLHASCIFVAHHQEVYRIHSFSILSDDRSKASSKTIPPHSAI